MPFSQSYSTATPNPVTVRTVLARRLSRVRFAWFVLGALCGVAVAYYLFSLVHRDVELSRHMRMTHQFAALESKLAALPPLPEPPLPSPALAALVPPAPMFPASYTLTARRGDTVASLLRDKGVPQSEADQVARSIKHVYAARQLTAGQSLELHLDKGKENAGAPSVAGLSIAVSPLKTITLTREGDDSFNAREIKAPVFKSLARAGGEIHSSLYQTGMDSGIPAQMLAEIIQAFSYDVDFQRDLREGDSIDVVFERMHTDKNATVGYGKIVYASLTLGDDAYTVYRHVSPDGFAGYYNARGESVRKALLKTPINGARITSGFGMRMHPLLGYSKMHKGIDFGAATGTPIYAAGDGVIEEAGRKGGYGNYVRVKHNSTYATAYGHASRIARGIRPGVHVKQGEVIAYVGSTGFSTGPHLHYEILVNGEQINPAHVKFRTGQTLTGRELSRFRHEMHDVDATLAALPRKTQVAQLESR